MRRTAAFLAAVLGAGIAPAADAPATFRNVRLEATTLADPAEALARVGSGATPAWIGWSVAAVPEAADVCCWTSGFRRRECSLADRDSSWGSSNDAPAEAPADLFVLFEATRGRSTRIRILSPSCPVNGSDRRLLWLGPVDPAKSLAFLAQLIDGGADLDDVREPAVAAVALHAAPRADTLLERIAGDPSAPEELRHQALFWAGNARGAAGYRLLDKVLGSDADGDTRQQAIFALTQSSVAEARERVKRAAIGDRDPELRGQALFWLAQSDMPGAGEWIVERLDAERATGTVPAGS